MIVCGKCGYDKCKTSKFCKSCWQKDHYKNMTQKQRDLKNKRRRDIRRTGRYKQQEHDYNVKYGLEHKEERKISWKKWYDNNKELYKRKRHLDNLNRKREALNMLGGAKCVNCGCNNIIALEFNHKTGGHRKSGLPLGSELHHALLKGTVDKNLFDVRCRPCNALHYLEIKGLLNKWKITYG